MGSRFITIEYEIEREDHNGRAYHCYQLEVKVELAYSPRTFDDPGENSVTVWEATCGGEAFELTDAERETIERYVGDNYGEVA